MSDESDQCWHHRRETVLRAQIVLVPGSSAQYCTVTNLSAGGAQLTYAGSIELSSAFVLTVPSLDLGGEAQVIWNREDQYGVTFVWPQHNEHGRTQIDRGDH
jgi:hypothetical protein